VPRPDESVALGVPNACNACHTDRNAKWAAAAVRNWYGRDATGIQSFAAAFHSAEAGEPGSSDELSLLAFDAAQPAIVRASALDRLAATGRFDPALASRAAKDPDPLVRLASVRLADALPLGSRAAATGPLLRDDRRAVRIEAARSLAGAQGVLPAELKTAWQAAADEYVATLRYNADRPESNVALGGFYGALGRFDEAEKAFAGAIRLDPGFVPAYVNAADALRAQRRDTEAASMLERGLAAVPNSAPLHHALGLARVRMQQTDAAMASLKRAVELEPGSARYTYVYAVALNSTGAGAGAIATLERALKRWPHDRDMLVALASFQLEAGQLERAQRTARRLFAACMALPRCRS
jgi:tetratricopeptide (TPR) repeat protein